MLMASTASSRTPSTFRQRRLTHQRACICLVGRQGGGGGGDQGLHPANISIFRLFPQSSKRKHHCKHMAYRASRLDQVCTLLAALEKMRGRQVLHHYMSSSSLAEFGE